MMIKLKFQYFGHLMWKVDLLGKTLMLGGVGGRRRRGRPLWMHLSCFQLEAVLCFYGLKGLGLAMDQVSVPPKIHILKLNAQCDSLRKWVFRRCSGLQWRAPRNSRISALIKGTPQSSLTPSNMWGHGEKVSTKNQETGSRQTLNLLVPWS